MKQKNGEKWRIRVNSGSKMNLFLTDAFPYKSGPFLPKPIGFPKFEQPDLTTDVKEVGSSKQKMVKKLQFIPLDKFDSYVKWNGFSKDADHAVTNIATKTNLM